MACGGFGSTGCLDDQIEDGYGYCSQTVVLDCRATVSKVTGRFGFLFCRALGDQQIFFCRECAADRISDNINEDKPNLASIYRKGDEVLVDAVLQPRYNNISWIATENSVRLIKPNFSHERLTGYGTVYSISRKHGYVEVAEGKGKDVVFFNNKAMFPRSSYDVQNILRAGDLVQFIAEPQPQWPHWRALSVQLCIAMRGRGESVVSVNTVNSEEEYVSPLLRDVDRNSESFKSARRGWREESRRSFEEYVESSQSDVACHGVCSTAVRVAARNESDSHRRDGRDGGSGHQKVSSRNRAKDSGAHAHRDRSHRSRSRDGHKPSRSHHSGNAQLLETRSAGSSSSKRDKERRTRHVDDVAIVSGNSLGRGKGTAVEKVKSRTPEHKKKKKMITINDRFTQLKARNELVKATEALTVDDAAGTSRGREKKRQAAATSGIQSRSSSSSLSCSGCSKCSSSDDEEAEVSWKHARPALTHVQNQRLGSIPRR